MKWDIALTTALERSVSRMQIEFWLPTLCHVPANFVVVLQAGAADEDVTVDAAAAVDTARALDSTVVQQNGSAVRADGSSADEWDLTPVLQEWKPAPLFKVFCSTWLQNGLSSTCHHQIIRFLIFAGQKHSHGR